MKALQLLHIFCIIKMKCVARYNLRVLQAELRIVILVGFHLLNFIWLEPLGGVKSPIDLSQSSRCCSIELMEKAMER